MSVSDTLSDHFLVLLWRFVQLIIKEDDNEASKYQQKFLEVEAKLKFDAFVGTLRNEGLVFLSFIFI